MSERNTDSTNRPRRVTLTFKQPSNTTCETPKHSLFGSIDEEGTLTGVRIVQTNANAIDQSVPWSPVHAARMSSAAVRAYRKDDGVQNGTATAETFLAAYAGSHLSGVSLEDLFYSTKDDMDKYIKDTYPSEWLDKMYDQLQVLANIKY